jgi:hypothetical protein
MPINSGKQGKMYKRKDDCEQNPTAKNVFEQYAFECRFFLFIHYDSIAAYKEPAQ